MLYLVPSFTVWGCLCVYLKEIVQSIHLIWDNTSSIEMWWNTELMNPKDAEWIMLMFAPHVIVSVLRSDRISPGRLDRRSKDVGRGGSRLTTAPPPAGSPSDTLLWLDAHDPAAPPPAPTPSPDRKSLHPGSARPDEEEQRDRDFI